MKVHHWLRVGAFVAASVTAMFAVHGRACATELRIGVNDRFPPFVELVNGQLQGGLVDALRAAGERAGIDLVLEPVPLNRWQDVLANGSADGYFPVAITPSRVAQYRFSDPVVNSGGAFFVRAPNPQPDASGDFAGVVIVTPRVGPLADYLEKTYPKANLIVTKDYDESLATLISGKADMAALNLHVGAKLANSLYPGRLTLPHTAFLSAPLAVAFSKGRTDIDADIERLNRAFQEMQRDGTLGGLIQRAVK